jgi:catechol 2,3-dioxygenase-like lactoylglutathione lyase family enzyme
VEIVDVQLEGTYRKRWSSPRDGQAAARLALARDGRPLRGIPVSDYRRALAWYERLLGSEPAFLPNATEAVWELAEHRYLYIEELPERAGHALHLVFVDNLDERVDSISGRGIEPASQETYGDGVRKVIYRDLDGNEVSFGGAPLE